MGVYPGTRASFSIPSYPKKPFQVESAEPGDGPHSYIGKEATTAARSVEPMGLFGPCCSFRV